MKELAPCGTYGAYQRHLRRYEDVCPACKEASRAYIREYRRASRAKDPSSRQPQKYAAARGRALARLAHIYPEIYRALYVEEMGK